MASDGANDIDDETRASNTVVASESVDDTHSDTNEGVSGDTESQTGTKPNSTNCDSSSDNNNTTAVDQSNTPKEINVVSGDQSSDERTDQSPCTQGENQTDNSDAQQTKATNSHQTAMDVDAEDVFLPKVTLGNYMFLKIFRNKQSY